VRQRIPGTAAGLVGPAIVAGGCGKSTPAASISTSPGDRGALTAPVASTSGMPMVLGLASPLTADNPGDSASKKAIAEDTIADTDGYWGGRQHPSKLAVRSAGGVLSTSAVPAFEAHTSAGACLVSGEWTSTNFEAASTFARAERKVLIGRASATDGPTAGKTSSSCNKYQRAQCGPDGR